MWFGSGVLYMVNRQNEGSGRGDRCQPMSKVVDLMTPDSLATWKRLAKRLLWRNIFRDIRRDGPTLEAYVE